MPEAVTTIDKKRTDVKNIYPDSIVSNTDTRDIKHAIVPTKHIPNSDKYHIKHTITPTHYGLADPIMSQSDIIQVRQQKK